jgi:hypothetical protein
MIDLIVYVIGNLIWLLMIVFLLKAIFYQADRFIAWRRSRAERKFTDRQLQRLLT